MTEKSLATFAALVIIADPSRPARMAQVAGIDNRLDDELNTFLKHWKGKKSAKLSLKSDKGYLTVILELSIGHFCENQKAGRGHQ